MGIDVAIARGLDIVVLDDSLRVVFGPATLRLVGLPDLVRRIEPDVIAIDSPPAWGVSGKSRPIERQLQGLGITIFPVPAAEFAKDLHRWMETGFDVFKVAGDMGYALHTGGASFARSAIEVFPHATAACRPWTTPATPAAAPQAMLGGSDICQVTMRSADRGSWRGCGQAWACRR